MIRILILFFIIIALSSTGKGQALVQHLSQQGWPASFTELYNRLNQNPEKNYIVLTTLFPTKAIDYRTENGIRDSVNQLNFQKNYHPGHQMIGWKCQLNGINHTSFTGFNGELKNQIRRMLSSGWGLTSLLATFTDGYLENPGHLENRFQEWLADNENSQFLMTTVFEVSSDDCEQVINEVYNFASATQQPATKFSLLALPEKEEGAVCNSFALNLIRNTREFQNISPLLYRNLSLPQYLFGQGSELPENVILPTSITKLDRKKKVSVLGLIASDWRSSVDPSVKLRIVDTELMIYWQKLHFKAYFDQLQSEGLQIKKEKKAFFQKTRRGFWERSQSHYDPSSINTYMEIDKDLDEHTQKIHDFVTTAKESKHYSLLRLNQYPILIIENKSLTKGDLK